MTRFRVVLGLLVAGLITTAAPAANADSSSVPDARGDVWQLNTDDSDLEEVWIPSARQTNVDLVRTVVSHKRGSLVLKGKFVDLRRNRDVFVLGMNTRDESGHRFAAGVHVRPGDRQGKLFVERGRSGAGVRCARATKSIDYAANTIVVRVPRSCVGAPRWIQFQAAGVSANWRTDGFYFDDARSGRAAWKGGWSAKIRRG